MIRKYLILKRRRPTPPLYSYTVHTMLLAILYANERNLDHAYLLTVFTVYINILTVRDRIHLHGTYTVQ